MAYDPNKEFSVDYGHMNVSALTIKLSILQIRDEKKTFERFVLKWNL